MENQQQHLEALKDIRQLMKQSNRFLSLSGLSGIFAGVYALIGAYAGHSVILNFIIDVANEKSIPFQRAAASRSTGTDTDSFAYSAEGVASALISLPQKYMHTTVEMCHKDDINACIDMYYEVLLKLEAGQDFRYMK